MKLASIQSTILFFAVVFFGGTPPVFADSGKATDDAFAALLSMPGAQPKEGGWLIPEQSEPAPINEDELIKRLQSLKKAGAKFDAIRHGGTLLAHTLRADKQRTAIWLLQNGANPKLGARDDKGNAYELARRFEREAIIKLLESTYGFKPPLRAAPQAKLPSTESAVLAMPQTRPQQALALINTLLPSHRVATKENQQEWQKFAATLSAEEFAEVFKDGRYLSELIWLQRDIDGGVENALSRLPREWVRGRAQEIANILAEWSYVEYSGEYGKDTKIRYSNFAKSWPALWSRIDQPLAYDKKPLLAGNIPSALWPGLFASGYAQNDIEVTGCLLSALDVDQFKALWPEFQRFFPNAREEAPALVLAKYRLAGRHSPCYYSSKPTTTIAKLAFLREQGVNSPVAGLSPSVLNDEASPALLEITAHFSSRSSGDVRLSLTPLSCELKLGDLWLDMLIKQGNEREPMEYAYALDIPGQSMCGLAISDRQLEGWPRLEDDFFDGPTPMGSFNCSGIELPQDGAVFFEQAGKLRSFSLDLAGSWPIRAVKDRQTGRSYMLSSGVTGSLCQRFSVLPRAYQWSAASATLNAVALSEDYMLDKLLRKQCKELPETKQVVCEGIDQPAKTDSNVQLDASSLPVALLQGVSVDINQLVDILGVKRRQAYKDAVASRNHAQVKQLLAAGIPARWTAAEIIELQKADLSLAEKRRRIALLFANSDQLERAMKAQGYSLTESLLAWLPEQDWSPILRVIERSPSSWAEMAGNLRNAAAEKEQLGLACHLDHAQGFLCGGGLSVE